MKTDLPPPAPLPIYSNFIDITGECYGRLKVEYYVGVKRHPSRKTSSLWACECVCGKKLVVHGCNLKRGISTSCGCTRGTHRASSSPEYEVWTSMLQRCNNPKNPGYKNYGARGIRVVSSWRDFNSFIKDMGHKPSPSHTLDRIDNDQGYSKSNCRWATREVQGRNRRTNRMVTIAGITRCTAEWVELIGISHSAFLKRIHKGWDDTRLLLPPDRSCWTEKRKQKALLDAAECGTLVDNRPTKPQITPPISNTP